ncbi:MAG: formyl transferase domain protein [Flavipsychrobacter sp.]|jgi:methionyl-tRNA formyltransferase|nr:formyl transferase domain protein [Flavipsychrobacter sp.]
MVRKKIVFLGSKPIGYRCLYHLLQEQDALNVEVAGILTQHRKEFSGDGDLLSLAQKHEVSVLEDLDALPECDIIYSVQYHQILKQEHINKASQIAVNLHMAPLPEYRGSNQFSYAIIQEKSEFGTTIHQIDERIDHGAILFQKRFPIPDNCWVNDLYELTFSASVKLFQQTLKHIIEGNYNPVPQQSLMHKYGTSLHFRQEIADLKKIDLSWDKEKIERHIRATAMPGFEPPYAEIDGQKIYLSTTAS